MKTIIDDYIYYTVMFNIKTVKLFIELVMTYYASLDAIQGRHIVDAKSILGMYSLNLMEPITIKVYQGDLMDDDEQRLDQFLLPLEVQKQ